MSNEVIIAVISGLVTLCGTIYTVYKGNSKTLYRLEQLEKKVEQHNSIVERTYKLESKVETIEKNIERIHA